MKEKSWALYKECKNFLEINDRNWGKRKEERGIERKKIERLSIAHAKQERLKSKIKEKELRKELDAKLYQLPQKERNILIKEEDKLGLSCAKLSTA